MTTPGCRATTFTLFLRFATFTLIVGLPCTPVELLAQIRSSDGKAVRLAPAGSVTSWPASAKRFALVIGVDTYADTQITTLGGASNDAHALAAALEQYAGFPADQITVLASDAPAERQPTRGNILRRLSNLRAAIASSGARDGLLMVAFSGHGMERQGRAFLLPSDAQVADDADLLEQTAIDVEQMRRSIEATGVAQVVVLLDACRNDPAGRADATNPLTETYTRAFDFERENSGIEAYVTLYATSVGARAYEYREKRQGYFTWAIVEALKGGAADAAGRVTLAALVRYVQQTVPKKVALDLGAGKTQVPRAEMGRGYLADALVVAATRPLAPVVAGPGPGAGSVDPKQVELAYWNAIASSTDAEDFRGYLRKYPAGEFAEIATRKIRRLAPEAPASAPAAEVARPAGVPAAVRPQTVGSSVELGNGVQLETMLVPAGSFDMGTNDGEANEQPVHRVTISEPFAMGKYEVTQAQWTAVMGTNPSEFKGGNLPVEQVSWEDVQRFVWELNERTGGGWRLPTEAEWEYACRAGTKGDHAGSLDAMGWYDGNARGTTHAVGQKQANDWGLYDMHGNVWEWCADWYDAYINAAVTDPKGASAGTVRADRGGGWRDPAAYCRSANRSNDAPGSRYNNLGFRLVRTIR